MLGLYLHVPFCQAICSYCNFNRGLFDAELKARYVDALEREIRAAGDGRAADTIFFGGGTPSLLDPADVHRLVEACRASYALAAGAEVTLEVNPETVDEDRLGAFLRAGVTRISMGVQSFDDDELARLGRVHSARRAVEAVDGARRAGCANVSLDLMLWLPGQSRDSWRRTVTETIRLAPEHLSMYLLELYPNAPLKESMARAGGPSAASAGAAADTWLQVADDEAADMYLDGLSMLDAAGYAQYEISNVARPGFASRHNLKYWQGGDWRGFGCGAHSTVDGVRWRNRPATTDYIALVGDGRSPAVDRRRLSAAEQGEEGLFTGLRLSAGVDRDAFSRRHGFDPWARYREPLAAFEAEGLVWMEAGRFGLTRRGMLVSNDILVTFI